jgi:hypothetical protein
VAAYFAKVQFERLPPALFAILAAIVLQLTSAPAQAQTQALTLSNKGGGKIVITLRECVILGKREPVLRNAYGYNAEGLYMNGCWGLIDNMVHIIWEDNGYIERRVYPRNDFMPMEVQ